MDDRDILGRVLDLQDRHLTALVEAKHLMLAIQKEVGSVIEEIDQIGNLISSTSKDHTESISAIKKHTEDHTQKVADRNEILKSHFWIIQGIQAAIYAAFAAFQYFHGR